MRQRKTSAEEDALKRLERAPDDICGSWSRAISLLCILSHAHQHLQESVTLYISLVTDVAYQIVIQPLNDLQLRVVIMKGGQLNRTQTRGVLIRDQQLACQSAHSSVSSLFSKTFRGVRVAPPHGTIGRNG